MIHIAICEDNDEDMAHVRSMLCQTNILYDLAEYNSAESLLFDIETNQKQFDIFILDIYLPGQNGVEAARQIRAANENTILIFLTSSEEFYREAFDLYAFNYLIKPVSPDDLTRVLRRALSLIDVPEETLQITFRGQNTILRQADVMYISSSNHALCFHMKGGQEHTYYGRLDKLETQLASEMFVRCHKSFIINLLYVNRLVREGFYIDDTLIPISRTHAAKAKERYHRRLFGVFQDN